MSIKIVNDLVFWRHFSSSYILQIFFSPVLVSCRNQWHFDQNMHTFLRLWDIEYVKRFRKKAILFDFWKKKLRKSSHQLLFHVQSYHERGSNHCLSIFLPFQTFWVYLGVKGSFRGPRGCLIKQCKFRWWNINDYSSNNLYIIVPKSRTTFTLQNSYFLFLYFYFILLFNVIKLGRSGKKTPGRK